jgi:hypothetical protein
MNKTRCKFVVTGIKKENESTNLTAEPVMHNDKSEYEVPEENKAFWEATPCGSLQLSVSNDSLAGINQGDQFYLDLIPVN